MENLIYLIDKLEFLGSVIHGFCQVVSTHKQITTTTMISKKIRQVVFSHMNEKITPTQTASIINMDVAYICRHFKQDT